MQRFEFNTVARIISGVDSALDLGSQCEHLNMQ